MRWIPLMRLGSRDMYGKEKGLFVSDPFRAIRRFWYSLRGKSGRRESMQRIQSLKGEVSLLVVCYGNICRSPVVERMLRDRLPPDRFRIRSCGLLPREGAVTPEDYLLEAKRFGLDLSGHRSRYISKTLVDWATVIIIMDQKNLDLLQEFGPSAIEKAIWLGAWDPDGVLEIPDPFGKSAEKMRAIIGRMERSSRNLARSLSLPPRSSL
ncbi:MAG: arsenate reductase/protein-tyrosine-phosphatase family protein [Leptospirales bacterium]